MLHELFQVPPRHKNNAVIFPGGNFAAVHELTRVRNDPVVCEYICGISLFSPYMCWWPFIILQFYQAGEKIVRQFSIFSSVLLCRSGDGQLTHTCAMKTFLTLPCPWKCDPGTDTRVSRVPGRPCQGISSKINITAPTCQEGLSHAKLGYFGYIRTFGRFWTFLHTEITGVEIIQFLHNFILSIFFYSFLSLLHLVIIKLRVIFLCLMQSALLLITEYFFFNLLAIISKLLVVIDSNLSVSWDMFGMKWHVRFRGKRELESRLVLWENWSKHT